MRNSNTDYNCSQNLVNTGTVAKNIRKPNLCWIQIKIFSRKKPQTNKRPAVYCQLSIISDYHTGRISHSIFHILHVISTFRISVQIRTKKKKFKASFKKRLKCLILQDIHNEYLKLLVFKFKEEDLLISKLQAFYFPSTLI
jgi:hypothetical protein